MYKRRPYWEEETPQEILTDKIWLTYYPGAGRLQIATVWKNQDGPQHGKTVTMAAEDIAAYPEACAIIQKHT